VMLRLMASDYSAELATVAQRLLAMQPSTHALWGRMTAHQMVCHIADSFRVADGSKDAKSLANWFTRNIMKRLALQTPLRPPRGIRSPKEVDQLKGGTPPTVFEADRAETLRLIEHFRALSPDHPFGAHPLFGPLTHDEWLIFHRKHLDHHLRQFGR